MLEPYVCYMRLFPQCYWLQKDTDPALGPGHSCVLRVDPGGHIIYWTREFNRTKSKAIEYYYKFIADIVDVRKGKYAVLEQAASISQANILRECLMTIVTNVDFVNPEFHTFMSTPDESKEVDEWADYIFKLSQETRRTQRGVLFYMQKLFAPIRYASCKELITIDDIVKIIVPCESNIADSTRIHKALMASELFFGKNGIPRTSFTDEHIFDIYMAITDRREIYHIFARRTRDRKTRILPGRMELKKVKRFLNHVQRDPRQNEVIFPEECNQSVKKIIDKFNGNRKFLSEKAFAKYLLSDENVEITNYSLRFAEENMHQPLSCYFINSSHNSYLIGAQIRHARYFCANQSSSADVEMYRQILLSGCRCVELDCWDGPDGEPIITHGPTEITLIQPVLFKDVCDAIAESAFKTSVYPVCLSIENHCSPAQQARMAEIFVESFGDLLLKDPLSDVPLLADVPLPSPYKLRRKILIKGRKKIASNRDEAKVSSQYSKDLNSFDLSSLEEEITTSGERSTDNEEIVYRNTINTPEILERNSKALYEMASIAITEESMNADESTPNDPAISFNDDQKRVFLIDANTSTTVDI
uniref:Phosphoinositide phospholipase C n=2 Tax=Ascaris TaxID=6251 RepID=A0A9J2PPJ2_ASCLU